MSAVFLDYRTMGPGLDLDGLRGVVGELKVYESSAVESLSENIGDAEFVFTNKCRLTESVLERASKLQFVGLTATGSDNVDLDAAKRRGIAVCNIRDYCTPSVVEHVFGVLLMLTHNLGQYRDSVRSGDWQRSTEALMLKFPVSELRGLMLGIVGYGALGRGVAQMGKAFGMRVLISARPGSASIPDGRVAFDELLERADVISLHCPLTEDTRGLIGAAELKRMQSSAMLINTARGALIDSAALVEALENDEIAGAAVDVLPTEPPVDGDPLLDYRGDNLIVTPHIAWASHAARQNALDELAANARAFLAGERRNRLV